MLKPNQKTLNFIQEHSNDDVHKLSLSKSKFSGIDFQFAIQQIEGKQRAKKKLPKLSTKPGFFFPPKVSLEQCSSELAADYKTKLVFGKSLLDLTGGLGIDCMSFSNSFDQITYIEKDETLCELMQHNCKILSKRNITIINDEAENFLKSTKYNFDWIYIDPSRRMHSNRKVFKLEDSQPNIIEIMPELLAKTDNVLVKISPFIDINYVLKQLNNVEKIIVVAIENECKEILLMLKKHSIQNTLIQAVNINKNNFIVEEYTEFLKIKSTKNDYSLPNDYIYEPNVAWLKAGLHDFSADKLGLKKLHFNTQLYTSNKKITNYPGRIFKLIQIVKPSKKEVNKSISNLEKHNIIVRNFPEQANDMYKKFSLKEGGEKYIIATTDQNNKKILLFCERLK